MTISIVVPCYNEEEAIPKFYQETCKVLCNMNLDDKLLSEFIFVDDGSKDKTTEVIRNLSKNDSRVHLISFSRNFGKEAAIYAGLQQSQGYLTALMDADLQDPPDMLPQMLTSITEDNYDCSATRRTTRKNEPPVRSFFSRLFYKIMGTVSDVQVVDGARDFRLMTKPYKEAILSLCEKNRFTKGIFPWVGFKTKWFEYENVNRVAGNTKWNFWKLFLYSIDGIIGFTTKPLSFIAIIGIMSIFAAIFLITLLIIRKLLFNNSIEGWASLTCIMLFISGVQLFSSGILGLYLSKVYTEVKNRPLFIIKEYF